MRHLLQVISDESCPAAWAPWSRVQLAGVLDDALDHLGRNRALREPADEPQSLVHSAWRAPKRVSPSAGKHVALP